MRVAFFGTPDVAAVALRALIDSSHVVVTVVTQPDRPRGRSGEPRASEVKEVAVEAGLPVLQPETPKEDGFAERLRAHEPQALAVVAYGHLLPRAVLGVAPALNAHFSLLPAYRGAAPVQRALMDGVSETGVSVFLLEPTMDTGPVVAVERVQVDPHETAGGLLERLSPIGARLLVRALDALERGDLRPQPQDDAGASPAPKITLADATIDWSRPAQRVADLVRALDPKPGARARARGRTLLVWRARAVPGAGAAGTVLEAGERLVVACGEGAVLLEEVQPEGKRRMSGHEYARGYHPEVGAPLG